MAPPLRPLLRILSLALLCGVRPAHALPPPPPPPCPDIGASYLSTASLVRIIRTEKDANARECAVKHLGRQGSDAMPYWIGMLGHADPEVQRIAVHRLLFPDYDWHGGLIPLRSVEALGMPQSAIAHFIEVAAASGSDQCGAPAGYLSDAGLAALPRLSAMLADRRAGVRAAAAQCLAELGPSAGSAVPRMLDYIRVRGYPEYTEHKAFANLGKVGIHTAAEFEQLKKVSAREPGAGPDREHIAGLSVLTTATLPQLRAAVEENRKHGSPEPERGRNVYYVHYDAYASWLLTALAKTYSLDAARILVDDKAYDLLPDMGPVAVPLLVRQLARSSDVDEQLEIIHALVTIGTPAGIGAAREGAARVLPVLLAELKRHDPAFRPDSNPISQTPGRFALLGDLAQPARPAVLAMLGSRDAETRMKAAYVLTDLRAFDAEPALAKLRATAKGYERTAYDSAIERLHATPAYLETLTDDRLAALAAKNPAPYESVEGATAVLAGRGARALPALFKIIETTKRGASGGLPDDHVVNTLRAIASMGPAANPAFTQLVRYLDDPKVAFALGPDGVYLAHLGLRTDEGMRLLAKQAVSARTAEGRRYSADVLAEMGASSPVGTPAGTSPSTTAPVPRGGDPIKMFVRDGHCLDSDIEPACSLLRTQPDKGVAAMTPQLRHPDARVRQAAADYLGSVGAPARAALPALAALLRDPSPLVRASASDDIGRIAGDDAGNDVGNDARNVRAAWLDYLLRALVRALPGADDAESQAALIQLGRMRRLPDASVTPLAQALADPRLRDFRGPLLRLVALTHSRAGTDLLIAAVEGAHSWAERDMAVEALAAAGPEAVPSLLGRARAARDTDARIAYAAALAAHAAADAQAASRSMQDALLALVKDQLGQQDTATAWYADARRAAARRFVALMAFSPAARSAAAGVLANATPDERPVILAGFGAHGTPADLPMLADLARRLGETERHEVYETGLATLAAERIRERFPSPLERWQRCMKGDDKEDQVARARCRAF